jgi:hypothetical protein
MTRNARRWAVALALLALALPLAAAKGKKGLTAPGRYKDWDDEIDRVEILKTFNLAEYERVVVEPFDTKDVELPEKDDNTYVPVKAVLSHVEEPFLDGLSNELPDRLKVGKGEGGEARTLKIRVKVDLMDPGSQAARYWVGFGAGASKTGLSGQIIDAGTGDVLVKFEQERRSGVGSAGGDYEELFDRNLEQIGEDIAGLIKAF